MREVKTVAASVKAPADEPAGVIEAFASVFGNVDSYGDRMMPGSFTRTLDEWSAKDDPIPVIWSHMWDDPDAHLGVVTDAEEREIDGKAGLWYRGQLDVADDPAVAKVYRLLKERRVTQQSFAYAAKRVQWVEEDNDGPFAEVRELLDVDLFEVGPTLLGANTQTELLQAASARSAAGRTVPAELMPAAGCVKCAAEQAAAAGDGDSGGTIHLDIDQHLLLARHNIT